jgi:two-component system, cell cycle response regulator
VKRILVVDDDHDNVDLLTQYLQHEGHTVQGAGDAEGALHRLRAWRPHLILLDINLPGISGLELLPKIRSATPDEYTPIILVSAKLSIEDVAQGLDAGADDYLTKPFRAQELLTRVRAMLKFKDTQDSLRRAQHRIEELASQDDVTGLLNLRTLYRRGEEEIQRGLRFKKPMSVLLVNLDGFSAVNREHGFQFGHFVLKECGKRVRGCMRSIDFSGRLGADEFLAVLVETDLANAEYVAERVRDAISAQPVTDGKRSARLTATVGVAGLIPGQPLPEGREGMESLLHASAEALASGKAGGRNRVEVYSYA